MTDCFDAPRITDPRTALREYLATLLDALCARLQYDCGIMIEYASDGHPRACYPCRLRESERALFMAHPRSWDGLLPRASGVTLLADLSGNRELCPLQPFFRARQITAMVMLPLRHEAQLVGCCQFFATHSKALSDEESRLLAQYADVLAALLAGDRYRAQLGDRTGELKQVVCELGRAQASLTEALHDRNALEEIVLHSQVVAFRWRVKPKWTAEYVSRNIERYGYAQGDFYAGTLTFFDLVHADDLKRVRQELSRHLKQGCEAFTLEYRMPTREGQCRWIEQRCLIQRHTTEPGAAAECATTEAQLLLAILTDITDRKEAEARMRYQAFHDSLTDLPNRALFHDRLAQAITRARRYRTMLGVLFLDLDRFKVINDTLGHVAGDHILVSVAERLRGLLREEDTIARFGGDEFIILLPGLHAPDDAALVAEKIGRALYPPFRYKEYDLCVSASIGISLYPDDGKDVDTLLQRADTALYHSKSQGKDAFQFYSPAMHTRSLGRLEMEAHLRRALEGNEFALYYDPQVSLTDGQLIGMEALLYWQHPLRGVLDPAQFMPVAEEIGLSMEINRWMLCDACRQVKRWQAEGYPHVKVAVDLFEHLFRHPHMVESVRAILEETRFDPQDLILEIGESVAMHDVEYSTQVMRDLARLGVSLSLDHFGTGYSSLIYLKKFPISRLKLDRSIVRGLRGDGNDEAIVTAIIMLAQRLQLLVIADGVESEAQQQFLISHQCDGMQGQLFSHALPQQSFEQLLRFLML